MSWMKVDDGFYSHPKMFDASDASVALWTRAGSWSAANLTDGFVPTGLPARLCGDHESATEELITRGVWTRVRGGFQFHDWLDYNPSREKVLADRAKDAEKHRNARNASAQRRRSARPRGTPRGVPKESPKESPGESAGNLVYPESFVPQDSAGARGAALPPPHTRRPSTHLDDEQLDTNRRGVAAMRAAMQQRPPDDANGEPPA